MIYGPIRDMPEGRRGKKTEHMRKHLPVVIIEWNSQMKASHLDQMVLFIAVSIRPHRGLTAPPRSAVINFQSTSAATLSTFHDDIGW